MLSLCISAVLFVAQTYLASLFVLGHAAFPAGEEAETAYDHIAKMIGGEPLKFQLAVPGVLFAGVAGALVGFLMLHLSVMVHCLWHEKSRNWLRHLVVPASGFVIVAYVLINAQTDAKIAGAVWMAAGFVLFMVLKLSGRSTALPIDGDSR